MKCVRCGGKLKIVRSVSSPQGKRVVETECISCERRFTAITIVFEEITTYSTGARSVAKKIADSLELKKRDQE